MAKKKVIKKPTPKKRTRAASVVTKLVRNKKEADVLTPRGSATRRLPDARKRPGQSKATPLGRREKLVHQSGGAIKYGAKSTPKSINKALEGAVKRKKKK